MRKTLYWLSFSLLIVLLSGLFIFSDRKRDVPDDGFSEARNSHLKVYALDLPDSLSFAGETVPMDLYWVRESYDRELLTNVYWHSSTFLTLKRAPRYFPVIEPILKSKGIPEDFKFLALAESNFTNVVSPSGAAGFWQFLKETGQRYGLEINDEVDERYNLERATEAACDYIQQAYNRFGSWTLAAAAYNAGPENVSKPLAQQKARTYYDVLLNQETSRYLFRIMAIREISKNPVRYGFHLRKKDFYPLIPARLVKIDSSITDLADFAISQGINYKILKEFNPWLRKNTLTNRHKKVYFIKIPDNQYLFYSRLLESKQ